MAFELSEDQLKTAENELKRYLPMSQQVYGFLVLRNRVRSDPVRVLVDRWPQFRVIMCKPHVEQNSDLFKDTMLFATDAAVLEEILSKSSVFDWSKYFCVGTSVSHTEIFKAVASAKGVPCKRVATCHLMTLEDVSRLPSVDSSGISISSLDESHIGLVNQTWKFGKDDVAVGVIRNMIANFPSCCVLDAERKPVSWILTYPSCAIGMLYTLPEHRGKGYAKILVSSLAKRNHALGYPVYSFIEEENAVSYRLFANLGFTEDPSYREAWFRLNEFQIFQ
ncbi:glycine N-acyltransferase isoform X1 [Oreochromis niloticus]|uniref:glycine N-acyltransferase isoform X1 n=1 Tax=Oreochromis niloticus TaxID=8128 RepID=UPI0009047369|nr:glycine N-acyltransferase isoform X1 [Oreochromis niloticus]